MAKEIKKYKEIKNYNMLKELIDQFYLDQQKDRQQHHFYITDAGKCPRAIFFKFKNAPRAKMDARVLRIYEHGEYLHRNILNILIRLGLVVAAEINIPNKELVSGRADAILSINNELYVLDIKSINSMLFRNLTAPKEENVYQIQLYLHFFNIKKGILLYIDKDQQEIKEFSVEYDPELCQRLLQEFERLKEKIDADIVPSALDDYPQNWQCNYCQFREICDLAGRGELSWVEFKKKIIKEEEPQSLQSKQENVSS